jgi:hypothetical protein
MEPHEQKLEELNPLSSEPSAMHKGAKKVYKYTGSKAKNHIVEYLSPNAKVAEELLTLKLDKLCEALNYSPGFNELELMVAFKNISKDGAYSLLLYLKFFAQKEFYTTKPLQKFEPLSSMSCVCYSSKYEAFLDKVKAVVRTDPDHYNYTLDDNFYIYCVKLPNVNLSFVQEKWLKLRSELNFYKTIPLSKEDLQNTKMAEEERLSKKICLQSNKSSVVKLQQRKTSFIIDNVDSTDVFTTQKVQNISEISQTVHKKMFEKNSELEDLRNQLNEQGSVLRSLLNYMTTNTNGSTLNLSSSNVLSGLAPLMNDTFTNATTTTNTYCNVTNTINIFSESRYYEVEAKCSSSNKKTGGNVEIDETSNESSNSITDLLKQSEISPKLLKYSISFKDKIEIFEALSSFVERTCSSPLTFHAFSNYYIKCIDSMLLRLGAKHSSKNLKLYIPEDCFSKEPLRSILKFSKEKLYKTLYIFKDNGFDETKIKKVLKGNICSQDLYERSNAWLCEDKVFFLALIIIESIYTAKSETTADNDYTVQLYHSSFTDQSNREEFIDFFSKDLTFLFDETGDVKKPKHPFVISPADNTAHNFTLKYIIVPRLITNSKNNYHWILTIICINIPKKSWCIIHFDSNPSKTPHNNYAEQEFYEEVIQVFKKCHQDTRFSGIFSPSSIPPQTNGNDCGFFVIFYLHKLFSQQKLQLCDPEYTRDLSKIDLTCDCISKASGKDCYLHDSVWFRAFCEYLILLLYQRIYLIIDAYA